VSTLPKVNLFAQDQDPDRDRILLIPGYLFFVESVPVSDALEETELESLAQLTLEGLTPFPLEQLFWGYVHDSTAHHILIFAAYQERLKNAGLTSLENFRQVYPDFLALTNSSQSKPQSYILVSPEGVTAAKFPAGARFPSDIHSLPRDLPEEELGEGEDEKSSHSIIRELQAEEEENLNSYLGEEFPLRETISRPISASFTDSGSVQFSMAGETFSTLKENNLWSGDLRSTDFANQVRSRRRRDQILWKGLNWAALMVVLFLFLEGLRLAGAIVVDQRLQKIESREEKAANLAGRNDLVNRLELRASGQLRPFSTLSLMNRTRPETIYFTTVEASDFNRFRVEGIASNPNEVNRYAESLREMGYFESVLQQNNRVVSGQVTFTLDLFIQELPTAQTEVARKEVDS